MRKLIILFLFLNSLGLKAQTTENFYNIVESRNQYLDSPETSVVCDYDPTATLLISTPTTISTTQEFHNDVIVQSGTQLTLLSTNIIFIRLQ